MPERCLILTTLLIAGIARGGEPVDFNRDVRPILSDNCLRCHGPDDAARQAGLRLDTADGAARVIASGRLLERVTSPDDDVRMPPPEVRPALAPHELDVLRRWIDGGAVYEPHWAFVGPERPALPERAGLSDPSWPRSGLDRFVLARLDAEGLVPSPEADRATLLRRVTLDLTGLPPTLDEIDAFVADERPDAYERVVDRLLASPHYGERWASMWLDLARYADTKGYEKDGRRTMWPYRDWVIDALNRDLPFDLFTIEQLAGDLLPDATPEQRLATAFHRNTMANDEGGTDDEEFRSAAVIDRVNTTMQVWMGLTMACAQCHTHKFDPISHEEYYRFLAFFNGTEDADRPDERPLLDVSTAAQRTEREKLGAERRRIEAEAAAERPAWEELVRSNPPPPVEAGLVAHHALDGEPADAFVEGEPAYGAGVIGRAADLDGRRAVDLGRIGDFERDQAFSYGAWFLPTSSEVGLVPVARMDAGNAYRGYDIFLHDGRVVVHLIHRWPENCIRLQTQERITVDQWNHVLVTYDGSSRAAGVTVYVDGAPTTVEVSNDTLSDTIRTDKPFHVGRRHGERFFKGRVDDVRVYDRVVGHAEVGAIVGAGIHAMVQRPDAERPAPQRATITRIHLARSGGPDGARAARIEAIRQRERELAGAVARVPVMRELPADRRRPTHVFEGGNFMSKGTAVTAGVPGVFPPLPPSAPPDRLALARWLVDDANPLTARVLVNRIWDRLFGTGLVDTVEDFGTQGSLPTHPALLDWLACEVVDDGWSLKALCRRLVTSATYRQDSALTEASRVRDPDNRLLGRGPRFRLGAETIRDQALAVSGLLNPALHGPPVFPPQPAGLWQITYSNDRWMTAQDASRHRRALYTFWRRTAPYPLMVTFDAPSREFCVSRRIRTNTPLQALEMLNDPAFVEAAQALARRAVEAGGPTVESRVAHLVRRCLGRSPSAAEVETLAALHGEVVAHYRNRTEDARALATEPRGPLPDGADPVEHAAWTVVANVILNLDEFLTKG